MHQLSPEAEAEVDGIWHYIATKSDSLETDDRFIETLTDTFLLLTVYPYIGRRRDTDLRPGMRSFLVGEYVILYRIQEEDVSILHVVRGSRNIRELFGY